MVTNEKESDVSLQFNTKEDQLDAQCERCKGHYFWTPSSVAIVKPLLRGHILVKRIIR